MAQTSSRILFINRVYPPARGTSARVLRDLAQGFAQAGWDVTILSAGQRNVEFQDGKVHVKRIATNSRKTLFGFFCVWCGLLFSALKLSRFDVVVTMTDPPMLVVAGRLIAKFKSSKHVHWCQDVYPDLAPLVGLKMPAFLMRLFAKISRRSMTSCDRVVAIGRCMEQHLIKTGVQASRVTMIPNWPDGFYAPFHLTKIKTVVANDDAGVVLLKDTTPKFRVLYSGTLSRVHPIATILEAAQLLQKQQADIEFVFMGEGPAYEKIALEKTRLGLENIRLLPQQPDDVLADFLSSGDVHIVSLKDEAAGMVVPARVYAAFAATRPCILIGPPTSEAAHVIKEYNAGEIIPQGRADLLVRALTRYRNESEFWYAAHQGAQRAALIYEPKRAIENWIARTRDTLKKAS